MIERALLTCDGCDEGEGPIGRYEVLLPGVGNANTGSSWQEVGYCGSCRTHAEESARCNQLGLSFNGQSETLAIREWGKPGTQFPAPGDADASDIGGAPEHVPTPTEPAPAGLAIEDDGNGGFILSHPAFNGAVLLLNGTEAVLGHPDPSRDVTVTATPHVAGGTLLVIEHDCVDYSYDDDQRLLRKVGEVTP